MSKITRGVKNSSQVSTSPLNAQCVLNVTLTTSGWPRPTSTLCSVRTSRVTMDVVQFTNPRDRKTADVLFLGLDALNASPPASTNSPTSLDIKASTTASASDPWGMPGASGSCGSRAMTAMSSIIVLLSDPSPVCIVRACDINAEAAASRRAHVHWSSSKWTTTNVTFLRPTGTRVM